MIREASEKDIHDILEIYNHAIIHTTAVYDYNPYTYANRRQWFLEKQAKGEPILVYEIDGIVCGFATFSSFRDRPAYKYTIEHSIYVNNHYSGKGIGTILLKELIHIAEIHDYKMMIGVIDASNQSSINFHEKLGFEQAGIIRNAGYKFGRWLDLAFFQLELSGPDNPIE